MAALSDNDYEDDFPAIKIVTVGDGAIGKTSLLISYRSNEFPTKHVPTIFENVTIERIITINGNQSTLSLDLWDTFSLYISIQFMLYIIY